MSQTLSDSKFYIFSQQNLILTSQKKLTNLNNFKKNQGIR